MLYFDANATAPPLPEVEAVYAEAVREHWYNPSSPYARGARVHILLDTLRQDLGRMIGCPGETIVFNSGATEGNNAIFAEVARKFPQGRAILSTIEHPCVLEAARRYFPGRHHFLPVTPEGVTNLAKLEQELSQGGVCLVSILAANNETGVLQPWPEAAAICRAYHVYFHTDAAQWLGKRPAKGLGECDFVTGCGHKFGAPRGSGFLKIPADFIDFNAPPGGGQENGHRSGTENYPALAAMVAALRFREHAMKATTSAWAANRGLFEAEMHQHLPGLKIPGQAAERLSNTSCLLMPEFPGARWVARLDKHGVAVSTGSACASGKTGASHVLTAMGLPQEEAARTIRVSASWETPPEAWHALGKTIIQAHEELSAGREASPLAQVIRI